MSKAVLAKQKGAAAHHQLQEVLAEQVNSTTHHW
jgi:hypothetical protein